MIDRFWCSRCLNNCIDLPNMIGSFESGATTSIVAKNQAKIYLSRLKSYRAQIRNLSYLPLIYSWDHIRTILGPFWDNFGTILGPFVDHFETNLWPFWGPFWDHFGIILGPFWDNFGTILGPLLFWSILTYFDLWGPIVTYEDLFWH